jgi:hypothetical protein
VNQYIYSAEQAGLSGWPSGTLRLTGFDITPNADEADVFVCPGPLMLFQNPNALDRLPYLRQYEDRHVFFDCSDFETQYSKRSIFIRCNTRPWYFKASPNTISWPWPVEDFTDCTEVPKTGFKYDVSFQGWVRSHATRKISTDSCLAVADIKSDISCYADFYGYLKPDNPEFHRRRAEFKRSMIESRLSLCPESIVGVFPYRFFEAMSAARVPVLVGSDFVFPFAEQIPYQKFVLHIERDRAHLTGEIIRDFLNKTTDDELVIRGKQAQMYWQQFLDHHYWEQTWSGLLRERIGALCASR